MEVKDKSVIIIGMGKSGISSAKLCRRLGANVTLYDSKSGDHFREIISRYPDFNYAFGAFEKDLLEMNDYMILSPGVPTDLPFIKQAKSYDGITVVGEIELAYQTARGQVIGITGTNGKTTTTSLVGEIIKLHQENTYVAGNIGLPYTEVADKTKESDICVIELSSYQLESIIDFRADVSAVLNVKEDHLQRHKTMDNYAKTKFRITENQSANDVCVLNAMDEFCVRLSKDIPSRICWFSMDKPVEGVYVENESIMINWNNSLIKVMDLVEIPLLGRHNVENVLAAVGICFAIGVSVDKIRKGVMDFRGVAHRLEFVKEIKGVKFYNDSKATNPDSAIKAVEAMDRQTVLIAGGMDKGSDYGPLIDLFEGIIKSVILFGETKQAIKEACINQGFNQIILVDDLEAATRKAYEIAVSGENVLLSPACASWDMFENFEVRGDLYKAIVEKIGCE